MMIGESSAMRDVITQAHSLKIDNPKKAADLFHDIAAHPQSNVGQILQAIEALIELGRNAQAKLIGTNLLGAEGVCYYQSLHVLELLIPIYTKNEAEALVELWAKRKSQASRYRD